MNPRPERKVAAGSVGGSVEAARQRVIDDRWNQHMTRLLRDAAEVREERDRARSNEDDRLARREAASLLSLIRGRELPSAKHHILQRGPGRSPGPSEAMP